LLKGVGEGGVGGRAPSSFHACWLYLAPDAIRYLNDGSASSPACKQCIIKLIMIHVHWRICWW